MERYQVIDADGHVVEPEDLWKRYLDRRFQDRSPQFVRDNSGVMLEGRLWPTPKGLGAGRPEGIGAFYHWLTQAPRGRMGRPRPPRRHGLAFRLQFSFRRAWSWSRSSGASSMRGSVAPRSSSRGIIERR